MWFRFGLLLFCPAGGVELNVMCLFWFLFVGWFDFLCFYNVFFEAFVVKELAGCVFDKDDLYFYGVRFFCDDVVVWGFVVVCVCVRDLFEY